jgi:hypothetical protein
MASDTFCFSETGLDCQEKIKFISVDEATDIARDEFSGIIGLAPRNPEANI